MHLTDLRGVTWWAAYIHELNCISAARCTLDAGDTIIDCPPTFTMYAFDAAVNQAKVVKGAQSLRTYSNYIPIIEKS